ncbi:type VI secretion system baseplate subunit TssK [Vibrio coralliilyticus]|uniref:type VI secretion system baseplate subunit TssK n=1 Tax=Vibrio coralliilyticus TaxID=190893 RepID=UPI000B0976DF|nr:type VI secretion system baseplate subunit TssK [Vibrio coralliilyticus]
MSNTSPIYWHQGMLLQPQHFQLESFYHQSRQNRIEQLICNEFWGVKGVQIQADALEQKRFVVSGGEFLFSDGSVFRVPQEATVLSREFDDDSIHSGRPFKVYIGIKRWQDAGGNVNEVASDQLCNSMEARFYVPQDSESLPDMYGKGISAQVRCMKFLVKVFWETELEQASEYLLLPIASLERDGLVISLSQRYVPPLVNIQTWPSLRYLITDISDQILSRARHIERFKPTTEQLLERGANDLGLMIALNTLAECSWKIQNLVETPVVHPRKAWSDICSIVAKLGCFVSELSVAGEAGKDRWPEYDHENLLDVFEELQAQIKTALVAISVGPQYVLQFSQQQEYWHCHIEEKALGDEYRYWLLLQSSCRLELEKELSHLIKLSPKSKLDSILTRSLSGIPLQVHPSFPRGLPNNEQGIYCEIDVSNPLWQQAREEGRLALFWSGSVGSQATLYVVRK